MKIQAADFKAKMSKLLRIPVSRILDDSVLTELVTDSFILVDMVIQLQEDYEVRIVQEDLKPVKTVSDLIRVFNEKAALG
jgi:acyl carrier protein